MKKLKYFVILALIFMLGVTLTACGGSEEPETPTGTEINPNSVPRFDGMAITEKSPLKDTATLNAIKSLLGHGTKLLSDEGEEGNPEVVAPTDGEVTNDTDEPAVNPETESGKTENENEETKDDKVIELPEDNMPDTPANADVEENLLPQISVNESANVTPFYAEVNQDVYVSVSIVNPESFAILRFTLNGVVYQSYQFETGSTSELLVLKVKSGDTPGIKEFTIDEIKYVSDVDNNIRDAIIEGNQTVKLSVAHDKVPTATVNNETQDLTSYEASVFISDPSNLVNFNEDCTLYFYDGENVLLEKKLAKGTNDFKVDNLLMGKTYQYMVVANYDRLDSLGKSTHVLLKRTVNTSIFCKLTNVSTNFDSISFDYKIVNRDATILGIFLLKDGEAIAEAKNDVLEFNNLLSNTDYEIRLYFTFTLDGVEYKYYDSFVTKTKAHKVPSVSATFKVFEASVTYNVFFDDEDNLINLKGIKLYNKAGDFIANGSLENNVIEGLNRNAEYSLRFIYSYDLNDGNGEVEAERVVVFSTSKFTPEVTIRPYSVTKNEIQFDILVKDPNVVGTINSIRLYKVDGESRAFVDQLTNLALRSFTSLQSNTKYLVEVGYIFDLDDGNGSQTATFEEEIYTARLMPTVDLTVKSLEEGYELTPVVNDPDKSGELASVEILRNGEVVKEVEIGELMTVEGLLSATEYSIKATYKYDLHDLNGEQKLVITKNVRTLNKMIPGIQVKGQNVTYSSMNLVVAKYDPSKICTIEKLEFKLGNITIGEFTSFDNLAFDNLYSNNRYTVVVYYSYDLNEGQGVQNETANFFISTLKRDNIVYEYTDMFAGETSIDFDLNIKDKEKLSTIKSIELIGDNDEVVQSLEDLKVRRFENLEREKFYTIVTTYEYDLNDGNGVQTDKAVIQYGTSGSKIFINNLQVLNNSNPRVGEEVEVRVSLENPNNIEITAIFVAGNRCEVLNNSTSASDVIVKFIPETEGGYLPVSVTGYEYVTGGIVLQDMLTSEYVETILVMGDIKVLDLFAISDTYYENYASQMLSVIEIDNPTGYVVTKLNKSESYEFEMIDNNHILVKGGKNAMWLGSLSSITYGLDDVEVTIEFPQISCELNSYSEVIHIRNVDELLTLTSSMYNSNYYILDNDIDLKEVNDFAGLSGAGVFDGNGHSIKNIATVIKNESTEMQNYGLFKDFSGIIFNLNLDNSYFSITTNGQVYVAGISARTARVYDSSVTNTTFDVTSPNYSVAGVSIIRGNNYYYGDNNNQKYSTNNYVENVVIKVSGSGSAALITDIAPMKTNVSAYNMGYDVAALESLVLGDSYIEKDGDKTYPVVFNDSSNYGELYINSVLENREYYIHTNCDIDDMVETGIAITKLDVKRDGYFVKWYDNPEFTGDEIKFPYVSEDKTNLYAKWTRIVLANPNYEYDYRSWWDQDTQTNIEGYVIRSFGNIDISKPNVITIGGTYNGIPVTGASWEAIRKLRLDADGNEDWTKDEVMRRNLTVYYGDTVNWRFESNTVPAKVAYYATKFVNPGYNYDTENYVPAEYKDYYNNLFYKNETYRSVKTFTNDANPFDQVFNLAETDDANAFIRAKLSNANNLIESIKYDVAELPYSIEVDEETGVKYITYNNVRFAVVGSNVYVGVKEITSDDMFKYIVYENDDVVITELLNPNLQNFDLTALGFTVTRIANNVFRDSKVRTIVLNEGLESIGSYAFANTNLQSIVYPSTLKEVGEYAFYQCHELQSVKMNDRITRIAQYTFNEDWNLREVILSNRIRSIEYNAFSGTNVREFILPNGLQTIGSEALRTNTNTTFFIPSTVKTINYSFGWDGMNYTIYTSASRKLGGWKYVSNDNNENRVKVFYNIKSVDETDGIKYLVTFEDEIIVLGVTKSIDSEGVDLSSLGNVVRIAQGAFTNFGMNDISINLKYVVLPDTVRTIDENAFSSSTRILSKANVAGAEWCESATNSATFGLVDVVKGEDFVYSIDVNNQATIVALSKAYTKNVVDFMIEGVEVTAIAGELFSHNNYISIVTIPEGVTRINPYTFYWCNNLVSVNLPKTLESIGSNAFTNARISSLNIPASVKTIGSYAFQDCNSLNEVILHDGLEIIEEQAFYNTSVKRIEIPTSVTFVGSRALVIGYNGIIVHHNTTANPDGWDEHYYDGQYDNRNINIIYANDNKYIFLVISSSFDDSCVTFFENTIDVAPDIRLYNSDMIEGWFLDSEFTEPVDFPYEGTAHINYLYAKIKKYIYVYYRDSSSMGDYNLSSGYAPLTIYEPSISKEGHYVEAWYRNNMFSGEPVTFPYETQTTETLYPMWKKIDYKEVGDFTYYVNRDGNKVLTSYSGEDSVVDLSNIEELENLVSIAPETFKNNKYIVDVIIPEGVTSIGYGAFYNANKLVSIKLPSTLRSIGYQAFYYCRQLVEITIPYGVERIENSMFWECNSLKKVELPEGLKSIGSQAFWGCYNLKEINLPSTLERLESDALYNVGVRLLTISDSVTYVGYRALKLNNGGVIIHNHTKETPEGWDSNFCGQDETYSTTPTVVYNNPNKKYIALVINASYDSEQRILYTNKIDNVPSINVYNGDRIDGWYLDENYEVEAVFPFEATESITLIYAKVTHQIDAQYFDNSSLYHFTSGYAPLTVFEPGISGKNGYYVEWYLDNAYTNKVVFPYVIEENTVFYPKWIQIEYHTQGDFKYYINGDGDKVLTSYTGSDSIVDLSTIEGLKIIGTGVFMNNRNITKVIIPNGLTAINYTAFQNCTKLSEVVFPETLVSIGSNAFQNTAITNLVLPESVTTIDFGAFQNCQSLIKVQLPKDLKVINGSVFADCYNLKTIELPEKLERIDSYAFNNTKIEYFVIPTSVNYVGYYAVNTSYGVIQHSNKTAYPATWDNNFAGDYYMNTKPIIFDDGKNHVVLVIEGDYSRETQTDYVGEITKKPSILFNNNDETDGFYLDKEFTEQVEFPYATNDHVSFIYVKVKKYLNVNYENNNGIYGYRSGFAPLTVDEPSASKKGYYVEAWYTNSERVGSPIEFPYVTNVNVTLYPKWAEIEYKTQGDYVYYLNKDNKKVITGYSGTSSLVNFDGLTDVIEIGNEVFNTNDKITTVIIPDGVRVIGDKAFNNCQNLVKVELPDSIEIIGNDAFNNCTRLTKFNMPVNLKQIGSYAFYYVPLGKVELPDGLTSIGYGAFWYANVTSIYVPLSVKSVESDAFRISDKGIIILEASSLKPSGWNDSCYGGFATSRVIYNNGKEYIILNIPADFDQSTKTIYEEKLDAEPSIQVYSAKIDGWYLDAEFNERATFPFEATSRVTFLYAKTSKYVDVRFVTNNGSTYRSGYSPVVVSELTQTRDDYYLEGWYLDQDLTEKATFPYVAYENITFYPKWIKYQNIESADHKYYYYEREEGIVITNYIANDSIIDLSTINTDNVKLVGIGVEAFMNNSNLTTITIPATVKFIDSYAFYQCSNLTTVNFENDSELVRIADYAFYNCRMLDGISLPEGLTSIGSNAFEYCSGLTSIVLPEALLSIGTNAFYDCDGLEEITIPSHMTLIANYTFYNCSNLKKVVLPEGIIEIGSYAFCDCVKLKDIILPSTLLRIRNFALADTAIRILDIPESVTLVEDYALYTNSQGVIIHHNDIKTPSGWNDNYAGSRTDASKPTVIYDNGYRYVVLVYDETKANLSNVSSVAYINNVTVEQLQTLNTLDNSFEWYTTPTFNENTKLDLTQIQSFEAIEGQSVTFLYGKATQ